MSHSASNHLSDRGSTIILGSRSPRRRELLELLIPAERIVVLPPSSADEPGFDDLSERVAILDRLCDIARAKCVNVAARCAASNGVAGAHGADITGRLTPAARLLVVTADTVIVAEDARGRLVVLGQPPEDDGGETVRRWFRDHLFGRTHEAITALFVAKLEAHGSASESRHSSLVTRHSRSTVERTVTTRVTFRDRDDALLEWYISTGEPFGKAGAYGIQGAGSVFATRIEGSLSNVIGLPLEALREALRAFD